MKLLKLVPDNTNLDFMRWRNIALVLSILVTAASIALVAVNGLNLGIDFVGGQVVRTNFAQAVNIEDLRKRVDALELGEASIQQLSDAKTYQVRLPKPEGADNAASAAVTKLRTMILQSYPGARVDAGESVSGKVSGELAWDGALAITLAMLGIATYIWIRFFRFPPMIQAYNEQVRRARFFSQARYKQAEATIRARRGRGQKRRRR